MGDSEVFCAQSSADQQESLDGTAPGGLSHWLLVEDNGPWGPKEPNALSLLNPDLRAAWDALGKRPGLRRLYLRRPRQVPTMPNAPRRFWIGQLGQGGGGVFELPACTLETMLAKLEAQSLSELAQEGRRVDDLWLVCTHGRRDRCCSLHGTGVFAGLDKQIPGKVWQCSHLGGHRFAATALHLPSGYLWGRLNANDAPKLAQVGGLLKLALPHKLRGHSGLHKPAQLVDLALRRRDEAWSFDCHPDLWNMPADSQAFRLPSGEEIELQPGPTHMVYGSCGDPAPKARPSLVARWVPRAS